MALKKLQTAVGTGDIQCFSQFNQAFPLYEKLSAVDGKIKDQQCPFLTFQNKHGLQTTL